MAAADLDLLLVAPRDRTEEVEDEMDVPRLNGDESDVELGTNANAACGVPRTVTAAVVAATAPANPVRPMVLLALPRCCSLPDLQQQRQCNNSQ